MALPRADKNVIHLTNQDKPFETLNINPVSYSRWYENQSLKKDKESRHAYIQYLLENKLIQE